MSNKSIDRIVEELEQIELQQNKLAEKHSELIYAFMANNEEYIKSILRNTVWAIELGQLSTTNFDVLPAFAELYTKANKAPAFEHFGIDIAISSRSPDENIRFRRDDNELSISWFDTQRDAIEFAEKNEIIISIASLLEEEQKSLRKALNIRNDIEYIVNSTKHWTKEKV